MRKKLIIGSIIMVFILVSGGLTVWKLYKPATVSHQNLLPSVKADIGIVQKVVFASGTIAEADGEEVTPEQGTRVARVMVGVGAKVKAGDVLFVLDNSDGQLAIAQEELNCQRALMEVKKAEDAVKSDRVQSQITGNVIKVNVKTGDRVEENTVIAEIGDPDILEVIAPFGPVGINRLSNGMKGKLFLPGHLSYIDSVVTKIDKRGKADGTGGIVHNVTARFSNPGSVAVGDGAVISVVFADGSELSSLAQGEIKEIEPVEIRGGTTGVVSKVTCTEGDYIKKNSILVLLDINKAQEHLRESRLTLRQAQLMLEIKKRQADKFYVRATQDGTVSEVNVTAGREVPRDKPAVVISGGHGMVLKAKIEEDDVSSLKIGQEAIVYGKPFGDRRFPSTITGIDRQSKSEGNSVVFETKIAIKDPGPLKSGMTGDVEINVDRRESVLRIPVSSVLIEGEKGTVLKQAQGEPKPVTVRLGLEGDEFVEVKDGLKPGDEIILNPTAIQ